MNTEIEIPVASLKSALPGLSKIIPKSSSLPLLQCARVTLEPDHLVRLGATNLDESVSVSLGESTAGIPGELLVPYAELLKLRKLPARRFHLAYRHG